MTTPGGPMNLDELGDLLDLYGSNPDRWPDGLREDMLAFVGASLAARDLLNRAKALDGLLDEAPAGEVHSALTARILADAPSGRAQSAGGFLSLLWPNLGIGRPAAILAASLTMGFFVGFSGSSATEMTTTEDDLFAFVFEMPEAWDEGDF